MTGNYNRSSLADVLDDAADFIRDIDGGNREEVTGWKSEEAMATWLNILSARAYASEMLVELNRAASEHKDAAVLLRARHPQIAEIYDRASARIRALIARADNIRVVLKNGGLLL
jgi:hypothetical protein